MSNSTLTAMTNLVQKKPGGDGDMAETFARDSAERVKALLNAEGIWYSITEIKSPGLKYIKIEASIKVGQ